MTTFCSLTPRSFWTVLEGDFWSSPIQPSSGTEWLYEIMACNTEDYEELADEWLNSLVADFNDEDIQKLINNYNKLSELHWRLRAKKCNDVVFNYVNIFF